MGGCDDARTGTFCPVLAPSDCPSEGCRSALCAAGAVAGGCMSRGGPPARDAHDFLPIGNHGETLRVRRTPRPPSLGRVLRDGWRSALRRRCSPHALLAAPSPRATTAAPLSAGALATPRSPPAPSPSPAHRRAPIPAASASDRRRRPQRRFPAWRRSLRRLLVAPACSSTATDRARPPRHRRPCRRSSPAALFPRRSSRPPASPLPCAAPSPSRSRAAVLGFSSWSTRTPSAAPKAAALASSSPTPRTPSSTPPPRRAAPARWRSPRPERRVRHQLARRRRRAGRRAGVRLARRASLRLALPALVPVLVLHRLALVRCAPASPRSIVHRARHLSHPCHPSPSARPPAPRSARPRARRLAPPAARALPSRTIARSWTRTRPVRIRARRRSPRAAAPPRGASQHLGLARRQPLQGAPQQRVRPAVALAPRQRLLSGLRRRHAGGRREDVPRGRRHVRGAAPPPRRPRSVITSPDRRCRAM